MPSFEVAQPIRCRITARITVDTLRLNEATARYRCILGGHNWQRVLRSAWIQLHQTLRGHRAITAI